MFHQLDSLQQLWRLSVAFRIFIVGEPLAGSRGSRIRQREKLKIHTSNIRLCHAYWEFCSRHHLSQLCLSDLAIYTPLQPEPGCGWPCEPVPWTRQLWAAEENPEGAESQMVPLGRGAGNTCPVPQEEQCDMVRGLCS